MYRLRQVQSARTRVRNIDNKFIEYELHDSANAIDFIFDFLLHFLSLFMHVLTGSFELCRKGLL